MNQSDKELLMFAFEQGISQQVSVGKERFLAVHLQPSPDRVIEESSGVWSLFHLEPK